MNRNEPSTSWIARLREVASGLRDYWTLRSWELALVLLVLFAFSYFFGSGSWNQNARLDAIYSFVEPGPDQYTFRINRFIVDAASNINTGDYAVFDSDYYANKAPLTILLGVVVYWPLYWFETAVLDASASHPLVEIANAYFVNLGVSVLFASLGSLAYCRLLGVLGVAPRSALWVSLVLFLGTALFPYSTTLWGVGTTTGLVVAGYLGLAVGTRRAIAGAGASLGFAVCSDYLAFSFVLLAAAYIVICNRSMFRWFCLGGLPPMVVLFGYHYYCFGSPLTTASSLSQAGFLDQDRWLGMLDWPSATALFELSFGPRRGIFFQMPVLVLAFVGYRRWFLRARQDPWLWLGLTSFLVPLVLVSGFNGWHGGASVSARYLVSALPWLVLPMKELPRTRAWLAVSTLLASLSALSMVAVASTSTIVPEDLSEPLYSWVYPRFLSGDFGALGQPTRLQALHPLWQEIAPLTCFNLGEVLGLSGYLSVLPWFVVCGLLSSWLFRHVG